MHTGVNLPAFPALFDGDAPATRQLRADGCQVAWGWISAAVQVSIKQEHRTSAVDKATIAVDSGKLGEYISG